MGHIVDTLLTDLRSLATDLGKDGGLMSSSVYDTAQVLRLYPAPERTETAINWLLQQQQADGGWGHPAMPHARDAPTLATISALQPYMRRPGMREVIHAGLEFLTQHVPIWQTPLPNDIPTAAELLLPHLLDEAALAGLTVPQVPYAALVALGKQRRQKIRRMRPTAGTAAAYSWEAWGTIPDPALLDATGGVGHSPAATAAWLRATAGDASFTELRQRAEHYMRRAAASTSSRIPGVFPSAWPVTRYEQAFAWYALLVTGLIEHPALAGIVQPQLAQLAQALKPTGLGFSDFFVADGDDTAAAVAVLHATGYRPDPAILRRFATPQHFCTYHHELQASITTTARAIHALAMMGKDVTRWQSFLLKSQQPDGRWTGDKWNSSWVYTTWHALLALKNSGYTTAIHAGNEALLRHQHRDGGWGIGSHATSVETAYGVLALCTLGPSGLRNEATRRAIQRGYEWLLRHYVPATLPHDPRWINKELYCPARIDQVFILSAMLAVALDDGLANGDRMLEQGC